MATLSFTKNAGNLAQLKEFQMETIQPVKFVSIHDALGGSPTDVFGVAKATLLAEIRLKPSEKYPQGVSLLGMYYSAETLDQIDEDAFWTGLPSVGEDNEVRIQRIREMWPVTHMTPDPRGNRRKLYAEIGWLRHESKTKWEYDKHQVRQTTRNAARSEHLGV
jgi:hypothetical protein